MSIPEDRAQERAPRPSRNRGGPRERRGRTDDLAVPVDPRWLWHDGWEPVRRRRAFEPAEARIVGEG